MRNWKTRITDILGRVTTWQEFHRLPTWIRHLVNDLFVMSWRSIESPWYNGEHWTTR